MTPPVIGPKIGIHAYAQSDGPFLLMGKRAWAILGPRSRAGLIAYPVGPPRESPIAIISTPTTRGFKPSLNVFAPIASSPNTNTAVPISSDPKLDGVCLIAGAVANTLNLAPGSSVFFPMRVVM